VDDMVAIEAHEATVAEVEEEDPDAEMLFTW
jgi:hypothetical protein